MKVKFLYKYLLIAVHLIVGVSLMAQEKVTITGTVTDASAEVPGVTVIVKGTSIGTITDIDGKYSISAAKGDILVYSFIGLQTQEIEVGDASVIDVHLVSDLVSLEEVVAIGYGKAKKGDLTSSIASVSGDDMKTMSVGNPVQALQGKASGVQIVSGSGAPGAAPKVLIRGFSSINLSTDPLYVVDGVPMGTNLNFLNNNEIENIQVLKDASAAAIYGSRASNGVILVTTKKGKEGKTQFSLDASYGIQVFDKPYDMADASEYAQIMNASLTNGGLDARFSDPSSLGKGTDWWGKGINKTAPTNNVSFQASGGTDKYNYAISLNYYGQESFYNTGDWEKFTARLRNEWKFNDYVSAGVTLNPRREKWHNTPGWYQDYMIIDPITPIYVPENERAGLNEYSIFERSYYTYTWNPIARDARNFKKEGYYGMGVNSFLEITPIKNLEVRTSVSGDLQFNHSDDFLPDFSIDEAHESNKVNQVIREDKRATYWNWTNTATYSLERAEHNMSLMIGNTVEKWDNRNIKGTGDNIPNNTDVLRELDATTENPLVEGNTWSSSIASFLGRVSYNYKDTYYLTATYRRDGSSKFLSNNKWASFPSASFAWRLTNENFMSSLEFIDDMKFRAGWGRVGNQSLPSAVYVSGIGQNYYVFGAGEGNLVNTTNASSMKNEDVKWETVEDINLGLDWTLFGGKLDGSFEWFRKETKDMLFQLPYPNYSGYPNNAQIWSNIGNMQSRGWEAAVNYHGSISKLKYNLGLSVTTAKVEMTNLADITPEIWGANGRTKTVEGDAPGFFYGYKTDGLFQNWFDVNSHSDEHGNLLQPQAQPGDIRFVNTNGDHTIDADDRVKLGSPWPDFTGGFNLSMSYEGFDMVANVYFSVGNDIVNQTKSDLYNTTNSDNNVISGLLNKAWHGEGTSNSTPRVSHYDYNENYTKFSDYLIEDGSFARLKNIQIGYTLPKKIVEKVHLSKCRFYVSGQNLLTLTNYSGIEPEVSADSSDNEADVLQFGFGGWNYPVLPTYMFGVNVSF